MSISRRMDKEAVACKHNGVFLSYKKGHIWVSSNEVDEDRTYCTEWSKSGRERQILYVNACVWDLERWYWRSYMQGSSRDAHKEQIFGLSGRRGWDDLREQHWNIYITICKIDSQSAFEVWGRARAPKAGALWQPGGMEWGGSWEGGSGGKGHKYTYGRFMLLYDKNHHNIVK